MCTVVLNFVYHRIIYLHWFYFFVCLDRIKILNKFQFVELNGRLMWCDFGANLLQHFMRRYSRYSRYQTAFLKLQEIITYLGLFRYKTALTSVGAVFLPLRVILSLSNFSVGDPVCTLFDAALQFDFASLRSG